MTDAAGIVCRMIDERGLGRVKHTWHAFERMNGERMEEGLVLALTRRVCPHGAIGLARKLGLISMEQYETLRLALNREFERRGDKPCWLHTIQSKGDIQNMIRDAALRLLDS